MKTTIITSMDQVYIKNNLIFINHGCATSDFISISDIHYVTELKYRETESTKCCLFTVNDDIFFVSNSGDDDVYESNRDIIRAVYDKILNGVTEYHNQKYNLSKPKEIKLD